MKHRIFVLGAAVGMLAGLAVSPLLHEVFRSTRTEAAAESSAGPLHYEQQNGKCRITGCDLDAAGSVIVPDAINGVPVTEIAADAFRGCESIEELVIPESVTSIGERAFWECRSLRHIDLRCPIKEIPDRAFVFCTSLTSLTIPDTVTVIREAAFGDCSALHHLLIPKNVTLIEQFAINNCAYLNQLTILNPDCEISFLAFYYDNLLIRGFRGSTAESYAQKNFHLFEALEDHSPMTPEGVMFGDVNGDWEVSADDAQMVLRYYVENLIGKQPSWVKITGNPNAPE